MQILIAFMRTVNVSPRKTPNAQDAIAEKIRTKVTLIGNSLFISLLLTDYIDTTSAAFVRANHFRAIILQLSLKPYVKNDSNLIVLYKKPFKL